jgi:hypothetical protein
MEALISSDPGAAQLAAFADALDLTTFPAQRFDSIAARISHHLGRGEAEEAAGIYVADLLPNLVARHLPGGDAAPGARRGRGAAAAAAGLGGRRAGAAAAAQTVNSEFAEKHAARFEAAFGAAGGKLRRMSVGEVGGGLMRPGLPHEAADFELSREAHIVGMCVCETDCDLSRQ